MGILPRLAEKLENLLNSPLQLRDLVVMSDLPIQDVNSNIEHRLQNLKGLSLSAICHIDPVLIIEILENAHALHHLSLDGGGSLMKHVRLP